MNNQMRKSLIPYCGPPTGSVCSGGLGNPKPAAAWLPRLISIAAFVALAGCTEEKAKALRLAAETFRTEADTACAMGLAGLERAVAMPAQTRAEVRQKLETATTFGASQLSTIISYDQITDQAIKPARDALEKTCEAHRKLAAIYTDLPRGYLLATADVERAQKHVVNVTVRFAKLAQIFSTLPNLGRDNPERIKIIESTNRSKAIADAAARAALLDSRAGEILDLQDRERAARAEILAQFGKAADLGERLVRMSMDYDSLTVADFMESIQEYVVLYGDITGRSVVAQNAIARVTNLENRIKNDPRLSPLLDLDLTNR